MSDPLPELIPYQTRDEWLSLRRTGIGGSDAPAVAGVSEWRTPLDVYLEKRGELVNSETQPMRWGQLLEPVVRQEYADRTGRTVVVPQGIYRHPEHSFAIVSLDGIADSERLYEGKTARTPDGWGKPGTDEIPIAYMLQVQHGMLVTGLPVADIAVLIGGQDFRIYTVEADAELQALLLGVETEFWQRVLSAEPPAPVTREDVRRRWAISSGTAKEATSEVAVLVRRLASYKAVMSVLDEQAEEIETAIQQHMADADTLTDGDRVLATWKNVNASSRFDLDHFRAEQPELYERYLRAASPQRRFLLKTKHVYRTHAQAVVEGLAGAIRAGNLLAGEVVSEPVTTETIT